MGEAALEALPPEGHHPGVLFPIHQAYREAMRKLPQHSIEAEARPRGQHDRAECVQSARVRCRRDYCCDQLFVCCFPAHP